MKKQYHACNTKEFTTKQLPKPYAQSDTRIIHTFEYTKEGGIENRTKRMEEFSVNYSGSNGKNNSKQRVQ